MSDLAIHVESLGKRYRIGERQKYKALRDTLTDASYAPQAGTGRWPWEMRCCRMFMLINREEK